MRHSKLEVKLDLEPSSVLSTMVLSPAPQVSPCPHPQIPQGSREGPTFPKMAGPVLGPTFTTGSCVC